MDFSLKKLFLSTIGRLIPSDYFASRFPVSVKGIFFINNKIVLLKNERNEWDLPGGKLNQNESIKECLQREIKEELSIDVEVAELIDIVKINIANKINVMVLVYSCSSNAKPEDLKISGENFDIGFFTQENLPTQSLLLEYQQLIKKVLTKRTPKV